MFDIEEAKKRYSDTEIIDYLKSTRNFDVEGARKADYKEEEILQYLLKAPARTGGSDQSWLSKVKGYVKPVASTVAPMLPVAGGIAGGVLAAPAAAAAAPSVIGPMAIEAGAVTTGTLAGKEMEHRLKEWLGEEEAPKGLTESLKKTAADVPEALEAGIMAPVGGKVIEGVGKAAPTLYKAGMKLRAATSPAAKATQERALQAGRDAYSIEFPTTKGATSSGPGQPGLVPPGQAPPAPGMVKPVQTIEKGPIPISKAGREEIGRLKTELGGAIDDFIATDPTREIQAKNLGKYFDDMVNHAKYGPAAREELMKLRTSLEKTFEPYQGRALTVKDAQEIKKDFYRRLKEKDFQQADLAFSKEYTKTVANAMKSELEDAFTNVKTGFKIQEKGGAWRDATLKDLNMKYGDLKVLDDAIFKAMERSNSGSGFAKNITLDAIGAALGYSHGGGLEAVAGVVGMEAATRLMRNPEFLSRLSFAIEKAAANPGKLALSGRLASTTAAVDLVNTVLKGREDPKGEKKE